MTGAAADPAIGLGQIQAADPAFNLELFKRQAFETFIAVKKAVEDRDLAPVVDMLTDSVYDDLRMDVSGLLARGAIQNEDIYTPAEVAVVAAERGAQGDAITLRINAVAIQLLADADRGVELSSAGYGSFTEFWTFSRPPNTSSGPQQPECPTCGAPLDIDTGRICRYCRTLLPPRNAQLGWVVAAIRPAQENQG